MNELVLILIMIDTLILTHVSVIIFTIIMVIMSYDHITLKSKKLI